MPLARKTAPPTSCSSRTIFPWLPRLQHGLIRHPVASADESPKSVLLQPSQQTTRFVCVPKGHETTVQNIFLQALQLPKLPPLIVTVVGGGGTTKSSNKSIQNATNTVLSDTMQWCAETGSWVLLPTDHFRSAISASTTGVRTLGMIALDDESASTPEMKTFIASLQKHCVPIDSPVQEAAAMDDCCASTTTALPSNLVVFETRAELESIQHQLLSLVPNIVLCAGDAELNKRSVDQIYSYAIAGCPLVLLDGSTGVHSGKTLCKIFRQGLLQTQVMGTSLPMGSDAKDKEVYSSFSESWPTTLRKEQVLLADVNSTSPGQFHKQFLALIRATYAASNNKSSNKSISNSSARIKVLHQAESQLDALQTINSSKRINTSLLHGQLIVFTLAAVCASVLYARFFADSPVNLQSSTPTQLAVYGTTIVLPFVITLFEKRVHNNSKVNPLASWCGVRVAAAKLESEIFKFRSQVGCYHEKLGEDGEEEEEEAITAFASNVEDILRPVRHYIPNDEHDAASNEGAVEETARKPDVDVEAPPTEETYLLGEPHPEESMSSAVGWSCTDDTQRTISKDVPREQKTVEAQCMTVGDYIELRLQQQLDCKSKEIATLSQRNAAVNNTIKVATMSTSAIAVLSLQWIIPIVLGVVSSANSGKEFWKDEKRLGLGRSMVSDLERLKAWWTQLPLKEKMTPKNKDHLIQESERIIVAEVSANFDVIPGEVETDDTAIVDNDAQMSIAGRIKEGLATVRQRITNVVAADEFTGAAFGEEESLVDRTKQSVEAIGQEAASNATELHL